MKFIAIILAVIVSLFAFSSVEAKPPVNQKAVQKAVQKELARERAISNSRARNAAINRARRIEVEREFRRRELIDFNRRLIFRSAFVDPFGVRTFGFNPFIGNRFFFANRNFAIGF